MKKTSTRHPVQPATSGAPPDSAIEFQESGHVHASNS